MQDLAADGELPVIHAGDRVAESQLLFYLSQRLAERFELALLRRTRCGPKKRARGLDGSMLIPERLPPRDRASFGHCERMEAVVLRWFVENQHNGVERAVQAPVARKVLLPLG